MCEQQFGRTGPEKMKVRSGLNEIKCDPEFGLTKYRCFINTVNKFWLISTIWDIDLWKLKVEMSENDKELVAGEREDGVCAEDNQ